MVLLQATGSSWDGFCLDGVPLEDQMPVEIQWPDGVVSRHVLRKRNFGSFEPGLPRYDYRYFAKSEFHGVPVDVPLEKGFAGALVSDDGDAAAFDSALPVEYDRQDARFRIGDQVLVTGSVIDFVHADKLVRGTVTVRENKVGPKHAETTVASATISLLFRSKRITRDLAVGSPARLVSASPAP